jgi:hypothetical protein
MQARSSADGGADVDAFHSAPVSNLSAALVRGVARTAADACEGGMKALTERQAALLAFIEKRIAEQGYAPSFREIGAEFGAEFGIRSTNGVNDHLRALQRKGYLRRSEQKSRAFAPTRPGALATSIRLLGLCREFGWDESRGDAVEFLRALLAARGERVA